MRKNWIKPVMVDMSTQMIESGVICASVFPEGILSLGVNGPGCFQAITPGGGYITFSGSVFSYTGDSSCPTQITTLFSSFPCS